MYRSIAVGLLIAAAPVPAIAQSAHRDHATEFTVRVENVSTTSTLKLSNGETAPAPTAPVLWVVHTGKDPVFTDGQKDRGHGLESLAEEGDPSKLATALEGKAGIVKVGAVAIPVGDMEPGPALPGKVFEMKFTASPGEKLTLAFMFGQSNDLFYAPVGEGIALFDSNGKALSGNITSKLVLWDAGTEVNQEPGLGPDQAPRQAGPNTGATEHGIVRLVKDQFTYPKVGEVVRVTVTPQPMMMGSK